MRRSATNSESSGLRISAESIVAPLTLPGYFDLGIAPSHTFKVKDVDLKVEVPARMLLAGTVLAGGRVRAATEELKRAASLLPDDPALVVQVAQSASGEFQKTAGTLTSFTPSYGAPEQFNRAHGATGPWTGSDAQVQSKGAGLVHLIAGSPEYQLI